MAPSLPPAPTLARHRWILFLHADTVLEEGWYRDAATHISEAEKYDDAKRAAAFRFALDDSGWSPRLIEAGVALRCWLFALPYGDQGLLISRPLYDDIGGYREATLFEDVDIVRRLGRRRLRLLKPCAVTSAARYRQTAIWGVSCATGGASSFMPAAHRSSASSGSTMADGIVLRVSVDGHAGTQAKPVSLRRRLIIMVKEPVAGRVKTRLARDVGTAAALRVYRANMRALVRRLANDSRWQTVLSVAPAPAVASRHLPSKCSARRNQPATSVPECRQPSRLPSATGPPRGRSS